MASVPESLSAIQEALADNSLSLVELVEHYIKKISENKDLNAFNHIYSESALKQARDIQEKLSSGEAGKLAGLVIGIKDNIAYKDHPLTASSKILADFKSVYNSCVVERLLEEDAIIIGNLNCDEFAMGSTNETSFYGPVSNPHNKDCVPGGSSGGSAAAVSRGLCLAALGTDTGGSVRQPAAYCGVVGLKPSYGRISRYGVIAYASSFDQVGIFSKNIDDCCSILSVIAGKDENDATSSSETVPDYNSVINKQQKYTVAYLKDCIEHEKVDGEIKSAFNDLKKSIENSGHIVNNTNFEHTEFLVPSYYILTTAEASSNLARYDGIHYGHRSKNAKDLESTYTLSRTEGFGSEVKRRIMLGTFVLSSGYYDAYFTKAQKARRVIKEATDKILDKHDFIMLPTTTDTAFKIGEKIDDPVKMYLSDIFTVQANLAGIPAISIPLFTHSNGMPIGVQIMSKKFNEADLLNFSQMLLKHYS